MGVLNVTPDSFSDGGRYLDINDAYLRAKELVEQGSDVIDIGAQSTRPKSTEVGPDEEIRRLKPVLELVRKSFPDAIVSIDTYFSKVADIALELGATWINDISGGRHDPNILRIVSEAKCPYVITHSRGNSWTMDNLTTYNNITNDVCIELLKLTDKAVKSGIQTKNIIWDPGLGFAKTTNQNITILRELGTLKREGFPLLIGPSRKRFIGEIVKQENPELRLNGTIAVACKCVEEKIEMIRVHDVREINEAVLMANEIF